MTHLNPAIAVTLFTLKKQSILIEGRKALTAS
ncbi:Uncharacterised protein [Yersinia aleksiciae]|uniref:Uncharacterized protein n=1 Tax=Yersinia aleksiciae TaxID=263819 RepID=A0A0T9UTN3_YERAE|nr:Uncharacterised protein [Yersinia aleksiciae]CNL70382.1 Uncharacterised protein [Yersinia aleksiciae]